MLAAIGLDEGQEAAYRALVGLGAAAAGDLARRLDLPEAEAERLLRRLESSGLAVRARARPEGCWEPAPPGPALGALVARRRHELERAERAAARLDEEYRAEDRAGAAGPAAPDGTDLEILALLLAGLTDASVAKQLGLGLRTVQRRVRGLMEAAGVTTRLQLGWAAYRLGWVAGDRPARTAAS
ncbi:helix-turn-helix domain-containing protein [Streptomyces sp. NPDC015131]|uniref:helix-turn-helix domain-containing protein n=1 Tax=Streptomyces sp. NPDC015131 TaxID=3364941 RepID=UPI0036FDCA1D